MSHFDDIEPIFYGSGPGSGCGVIGGIIFLAFVIACCVWAYSADKSSADDCAKHGEKYIDSRTGYTLCEQDGGTVVRR